MAHPRMAVIVPTSSRLPSSLRLNAKHPIISKTLSRLSRPSLISIVLSWLGDTDYGLPGLYLDDYDYEDDDEYPPGEAYRPARSVEELRETYAGLRARKGSKREVLDRIIECDWRNGLSLYQLAMVDLQYLYDHPTSQKWSAYRVVPLRTPSSNAEAESAPRVDKESLTVPRFHPSSFLEKLQAQVLPDVKAHYNFDRHPTLGIMLLRIFILDSPYNTELAAAASNGGGDNPSSAGSESSRTVYIAFPDGSPHIFISNSQTNAGGPTAAGEAKSLRSLIVEGIPKALSRPRKRYILKPTSLSTRNLNELIHRRGAGRTSAAGGGWSFYADPKGQASPLDTVLPTPPASDGDDGSEQKESRKRAVSPATEREERAAKRAKRVAQARFGDTGKVDDGKGVERVDIVIEDPFVMEARRTAAPEQGNLTFPRSDHGEESDEEGDRPPQPGTRAGRRSTVQEILDRDREDADEEEEEEEAQGGKWRPNVRLTFHGTHVFAGIRQLVEHGIVDGERMPGWMTGEEGVTIGAVRHGRIRGHKGSGI